MRSAGEMMHSQIRLGISPCPNDTYIFAALIQGRLKCRPYRLETSLFDVQALNEMALKGSFEVVKLSAAAFGQVRERYRLLRSGGALGRGCGPLLVAAQDLGLQELKHRPIAVPGLLTTAALLLARCLQPEVPVLPMRYDRIMPAVASGEVAAGVVIHEGRFTYPRYGLSKILDLGQWWEDATGMPVPLGVIAAKRELGPEFAAWMEERIRASLDFARANEDLVWQFVRDQAQEMDEATLRSHIETFVTGFSRDMGEEGERSLLSLLE